MKLITDNIGLLGFLKQGSPIDLVLIETSGVVYFNRTMEMIKSMRGYDPRENSSIKILRFWPLTKNRVGTDQYIQADIRFKEALEKGDIHNWTSLTEFVSNPRLRLKGGEPAINGDLLIYDDCIGCKKRTLKACIKDLSAIGYNLKNMYVHYCGKIGKLTDDPSLHLSFQ